MSLYERLSTATSELGALVDEMSAATYHAIEAETLKQTAIDAGIDHTLPSSEVVRLLGEALRRERDLSRELRRHRDALLRGAT